MVQKASPPLSPRSLLVRLGCVLMMTAAGGFAAYQWLTGPEQFAATAYWPFKWAAGFVLFVAAHFTVDRWSGGPRRRLYAVLALEAGMALWLIALDPTFLVTSLMVLVAWQIAWSLPLKPTLAITAGLAAALVLMKCTGQTGSMSLLILIAACAFQLFAVAAAHLARSEAEARAALARAHAELQAAHVLLAGSSRMSERLRISRDLHDALGHRLTTLTLQLDVAGRLVKGRVAAEHLAIARETAASLLDEVREVVGRVRVGSLDLRATLAALTSDVGGIRIALALPDELPPLDAPRADAVYRCVQEVITNALRHSHATELRIELANAPDGTVLVTASDNGVGSRHGEGNGLRGMRERFESLGGKLTTLGTEAGFAVRGALPAVDLSR